MIITDIKKQVKDTERYSIYIDNKFVFGLSGVDVLYYRLKIGNEIPQEKYDEILEFSELGEFIDVPIKNYSSGMKARLGFSIATVVEPEILILDEVLSVGDAKFRKKCEKKMQGMFDHGVTVLFVSHSLQQVERLCNKAILLDHGQLIAKGDIDEVSAIYQSKLND